MFLQSVKFGGKKITYDLVSHEHTKYTLRANAMLRYLRTIPLPYVTREQRHRRLGWVKINQTSSFSFLSTPLRPYVCIPRPFSRFCSFSRLHLHLLSILLIVPMLPNKPPPPFPFFCFPFSLFSFCFSLLQFAPAFLFLTQLLACARRVCFFFWLRCAQVPYPTCRFPFAFCTFFFFFPFSFLFCLLHGLA